MVNLFSSLAVDFIFQMDLVFASVNVILDPLLTDILSADMIPP